MPTASASPVTPKPEATPVADAEPPAAPPDPELAAYQALSASRWRDYDRTQDISARQLVILIEVAERTDYSLGQALATGEHESAKTWNDHVRPTLKSGNLGAAAGVWQFIPSTFHSIIKRFGAKLLAASGADAALGRPAMDLGDGPFSDAEVRALIQETVDGKRDAKDERLLLLRHNFAVLAFAKNYLSVDSGATTPEEDYLFHFLGEAQGRRVLALAQGPARNTLSVKPIPVAPPALDTEPGLPGLGEPLIAARESDATRQARAMIAREQALRLSLDPRAAPQAAPNWRPEILRATRPGSASTQPLRPLPEIRSELRSEQPAMDPTRARMRLEADRQPFPMAPLEASFVPLAPPPPSSEFGFPADSSTVTGNLGMFYRDGKGQSQPYTWGEFMDHLARRVKASHQPAMVRAKYGVGFDLKGGDLPEWRFDPEREAKPAEFRHLGGRTLQIPEPMLTGPLTQAEALRYKERLAALVAQGDDQPLAVLPPESLATLHHLGFLPASALATGAPAPAVTAALQQFRQKVGKAAPDDPSHTGQLLPAERVALEIYDRRLACLAELQSAQATAAVTAPSLKTLGSLPKGLQRRAAPEIATVQWALLGEGLLTQPNKKSVWRDKKRKKRVSYKQVPFAGRSDKATVAALNTFQWRHGLRRTDGVLDGVTLELLGLSPLGAEIFEPLAGPSCPLAPPDGETADQCRVLAQPDALHKRLYLAPRQQRPPIIPVALAPVTAPE